MNCGKRTKKKNEKEEVRLSSKNRKKENIGKKEKNPSS